MDRVRRGVHVPGVSVVGSPCGEGSLTMISPLGGISLTRRLYPRLPVSDFKVYNEGAVYFETYLRPWPAVWYHIYWAMWCYTRAIHKKIFRIAWKKLLVKIRWNFLSMQTHLMAVSFHLLGTTWKLLTSFFGDFFIVWTSMHAKEVPNWCSKG